MVRADLSAVPIMESNRYGEFVKIAYVFQCFRDFFCELLVLQSTPRLHIMVRADLSAVPIMKSDRCCDFK